MYTWLKDEKVVFLYRILEIYFSKRKSMYSRIDWETTHLGQHEELGWRLKVFSSFFFLILLPQGTFSLLCSKIQDYMLSLINKVDPCVTSAIGFVWDAKPIFPTSISMLMPCINKELIYTKLFMLYSEDSTLHHLFSQNQKSSSI